MHRFRRRRDRGQAAEQRTEAAGFAERLAAADARRAEPDPAPLAAPSGVPTIAQRSDVDAVRDELTDRIDQLADRIATLDARITSISTELANQLTELSGEADAATAAADAIRAGQERLANEQARYQIAFRQDLAELAERLRRR